MYHMYQPSLSIVYTFPFGPMEREPPSTVSSEGLFQSTMCGVPSINHRKRLFFAGSAKESTLILWF